MILVPGRGKDVLVDLIKQQNTFPTDLAPEDVFLSPPTVVTSPYPTMVEVKVIGLPDSPYVGSVPIRYKRINLTAAFGDVRPRLEGTSHGSLHALLPFLSRELGIELYPEDIEETDFSFLQEDEETNLALKAKLTSLSYTGQGIITFTRRRYQLSVVIEVVALDRLLHPGSTGGGKEAVNIKTYSTDFTDHYLRIRRHQYYNLPASITQQRAVMLELFGWSNWPYGNASPLTDHATSEIPDANQDYDRVLIQHLAASQVESLPYEGTAYFHYNVI